jgi:hypothetical protein
MGAAMIAATILTLSLGASVVISNDDWPVNTKDNLDTFSVEFAAPGVMVEYHMLTTLWNGRADVLEAGYQFAPGMPVGAYARLTGDLYGLQAQAEWHRATRCPPGDWGGYESTRLDLGLWYHQTVGPLTLDARLTSADVYARVDAAWEVDWAGCTWRGGAFVRSWLTVGTTTNEAAAEVHERLGRFGICGRVTVSGSVLTLQVAPNDLRGGVGWEF